MAAGMLGKKAVERGPPIGAQVKTSLTPGGARRGGYLTAATDSSWTVLGLFRRGLRHEQRALAK